MDKFKEKTMRDYTSWDINFPWVVKRNKTMMKLKKVFKKRARRKLKDEMKKYLDD